MDVRSYNARLAVVFSVGCKRKGMQVQQDKLSQVIGRIGRRVESYGKSNDQIVLQSHILAVNSMIEAARAGEQGKGFSVVAAEMKRMSDQTKAMADSFRSEVLGIVKSAEGETSELVAALEAAERERMVALALNLVQLIVRNLFERTADVRWWATEHALWTALSLVKPGGKAFGKSDAARAQTVAAATRLQTIHRYYTVYRDLLLLDLDGRVIATATDGAEAVPRPLADGEREWFRRAAALRSGHDYVVSDVHANPQDGAPWLIYATTVREGGEADGQPLGVLAVAFNWDREAGLIVREEAGFTAEEWTRSRVVLLDRDCRILADSDGEALGTLFPLNHAGAEKGCLQSPDGTLTAFARTIGYQDYDGLGWYGVVVRRPVAG